MNKSRAEISKKDIVSFFDKTNQRIFKLGDLAAILAQNRDFWRLSQTFTTQDFIRFLIQKTKLKRLDFPFPYRSETRYTWGDVSLLSVLLNLKKDAYFTHYTAVRMHGLTEQIPKIIYLNHEQPPRPQSYELEQGRINAAFARSPRMSQNTIEYEDISICIINGMYTGQLGVIEQEVSYDSTIRSNVRLTNVERTLIDITVRPAYSGGVFEVLKAFKLAREQVSVNRLAAMLQKLRYVYPYHQAIGFYLERAGYKSSSVDLLRRFPMEFDFYLAHQMGQTEYIKEWRLYIPKGF